MPVRKSLQQMKAEHDQDRQLIGKTFHHYKTGDDYQLLFATWDEETNEKQAVYVLCAMPWLKFNRPFEDFKARFIEGTGLGAPRSEAA
jgi:hypothetical protein